jgi:thioredoxin 2
MTVTCPHCGKKNRVPAAAHGKPQCGNCHQPLPWLAEAGDDNFHEVVEESTIPVVLDLWAPWCGPCRTVSPALDQLAAEHAGEIKLVKVNVDQSPQISHRFDVQSIPTLLLMRGQDVIARQVGAAPVPALKQWVDDALTAL